MPKPQTTAEILAVLRDAMDYATRVSLTTQYLSSGGIPRLYREKDMHAAREYLRRLARVVADSDPRPSVTDEQILAEAWDRVDGPAVRLEDQRRAIRDGLIPAPVRRDAPVTPTP